MKLLHRLRIDEALVDVPLNDALVEKKLLLVILGGHRGREGTGRLDSRKPLILRAQTLSAGKVSRARTLASLRRQKSMTVLFPRGKYFLRC